MMAAACCHHDPELFTKPSGTLVQTGCLLGGFTMAMKAIITQEEHDALSEPFQAEYTTREEGGFILDVTGVGTFALEDVGGLKTTVSKLRTELQAAKDGVSAFGDLTPETATAAVAKAAELDKMDIPAKVAEASKAREQQLLTKHTADVKVVQDELDLTTTQLRKLMITDSATKALLGEKGSVDLLLPHVVNAAKIKRLDTGEYAVEVLDANGDVRLSPATGSTAPMTIAEFVTEMKSSDAYARAFEGTGASGSGGDNNSGGDGKGAGKPPKTVAADDQDGLNRNLEDIAAGKVEVTMDG